MKRIVVIAAVLGAVLIAVNTFVLYSLNEKADGMNIRLAELGAQLARAQSNTNVVNKVQPDASEKGNHIFTPTELAEYLRITLDQVYGMIDAPDATIPYTCIDGEYRFSKEAIDVWIQEGKVINTKD